MKNFFKKIQSYGFWLSLSSALVMLLTSLGKAFGFEVQNEVVEDCVMSIAGFLAVFGIVSLKKDGSNSGDEPDENFDEKKDDENSFDDNDKDE